MNSGENYRMMTAGGKIAKYSSHAVSQTDLQATNYLFLYFVYLFFFKRPLRTLEYVTTLSRYNIPIEQKY